MSSVDTSVYPPPAALPLSLNHPNIFSFVTHTCRCGLYDAVYPWREKGHWTWQHFMWLLCMVTPATCIWEPYFPIQWYTYFLNENVPKNENVYFQYQSHGMKNSCSVSVFPVLASKILSQLFIANSMCTLNAMVFWTQPNQAFVPTTILKMLCWWLENCTGQWQVCGNCDDWSQ